MHRDIAELLIGSAGLVLFGYALVSCPAFGHVCSALADFLSLLKRRTKAGIDPRRSSFHALPTDGFWWCCGTQQPLWSTHSSAAGLPWHRDPCKARTSRAP